MAKKMAKEDRFQRVLEEDRFFGCNEIWVDTQTGVQYLYRACGNGGGMTVLVDAEGKPLLYRKPPDAPEFK